MVLTTAPPKPSPLCTQWVKAWPLSSFSVSLSAPTFSNTLIPPAHLFPQQHWCFSSIPRPALVKVFEWKRGRTQVEKQRCLCCCHQAQCWLGHTQALVIDVLITQWCSLDDTKSKYLIWKMQGSSFMWKQNKTIQHFQLLCKLPHEQKALFVQEKKPLLPCISQDGRYWM